MGENQGRGTVHRNLVELHREGDVEPAPHGAKARVGDQQADLEGKLSECSENGEEEDDTAEIYEPSAEELAALMASANSDPSLRAGMPAEEEVDAEMDDLPSFVAPAPTAREVVKIAPRRQPAARRDPGSKEKAAFTLRIAKDRHLKLRLACAVKGISAQKLVTEALDAWLDAMPELDDMTENASE